MRLKVAVIDARDEPDWGRQFPDEGPRNPERQTARWRTYFAPAAAVESPAEAAEQQRGVH